jgi:putative colanic acid biosynthesis glycosyltransferase
MKILSISRADDADIANAIITELRARGHIVLKADYAKKSDDPMFFSLRQPKLEDYFNKVMIRATGEDGFYSKRTTRKLLRKIKKFEPDAIIIHWIHQNYLNFRPLMNYCRQKSIAVILVANDTWLFTGRCAYFEMNGCYKWKSGCGHCPFPREYPAQYFMDRTAFMWKEKKKCFVGPNVVIVSPSKWLSNYISQSFLSPDDCQLIYNGTDLSSFYPKDGSKIREELGIKPTDKMIFGVARPWTPRKGLKYFSALAEKLPSNYRIVLRGVHDDQKATNKIIYIDRYLSKEGLADLFSAADVFVNPTQDEVWGLVNVEALGCGTPIAGFRAGGSPETFDEKTGIAVPTGDIEALRSAILQLAENRPSKNECVNRAKIFNLPIMAKSYATLIENKVKTLKANSGQSST